MPSVGVDGGWQDRAVSLEGSWVIVIPVKELSSAKSRLQDLPPANTGLRAELALAFASDVVDAAVAAANVTRVIVVTSDDEILAAVRVKGVEVVADPGGGLNAAIEFGAAQANTANIAAVVGDLPAATAVDLAAALDLVLPGSRAYVPDAAGIGTTLLATRGPELRPMFGSSSSDRHRASGAAPIESAAPGLRLDVDTVEELQRAADLGVGRQTRRWLAVVLAGAAHPTPDAIAATIRSTSSAVTTVFLDDGTVIRLAADATPWRPGQRVSLASDHTGRYRILATE
jgi:2-phospho-L-lactate guanylyltransferase